MLSKFYFKILVLGDANTTLPYISNALSDVGEDKETYNEWYKEVTVLDNECDLEINVILDVISADFDEIIPMVDGIIYFLNPLNSEEFH